MAKVMIVDDEPLMRRAARVILEKYVPEVDVIIDAESGRSAIDQVKETHPDIICMDLKMAGIDGVETTRIIKALYPEIVIIVISAFDEFHAAAELTRYGIRAYLLKPLDKMEFVKEIYLALDDIKKVRLKKDMELGLQERVSELNSIYENEITYSFLMGDESRLERMQFAGHLKIAATGGVCMVIRFAGNDEDRIRFRIVYQRIREKLRKQISREKGLVSAIFHNELLVFLYNTDFKTNVEEWIQEQTERVADVCKKNHSMGIAIGVGSYAESMLDLQESYYQAVKAAASSDGRSDCEIIWFDDGKMKGEFVYSLEKESAVFHALEREDFAQAKEQFDELVEDADFDQMKGCLTLFAAALIHFRLEHRLSETFDNVFLGDFDQVFLYKWCIHMLQKCCEEIAALKESASYTLIEQALDHIYANYARHITLDDIAQSVSLSPFYFTKLFKARTGKTFVEYLTEYRIEMAKEMLRSQPQMKINDIAEQVGYSDPKYFCKRFAGIVGMTPAAWRDSGE